MYSTSANDNKVDNLSGIAQLDGLNDLLTFINSENSDIDNIFTSNNIPVIEHNTQWNWQPRLKHST